MTNFEKIKAMSIEEAANFFNDLCSGCEYCLAEEVCTSDIRSCGKVFEKWLKSEVSENEGVVSAQ